MITDLPNVCVVACRVYAMPDCHLSTEDAYIKELMRAAMARRIGKWSVGLCLPSSVAEYFDLTASAVAVVDDFGTLVSVAGCEP